VGGIPYVLKIIEFWLDCGRAKRFFSQKSKPNEMIVDVTSQHDDVINKHEPLNGIISKIISIEVSNT